MAAYMDYNATTPVADEVREAMLPYLDEQFGNPSSRHSQGRAARAALDQAREQVAALVNALPAQIIFTSGASEANNLAVKGWSRNQESACIAVSAIEHPSILAPALHQHQYGRTMKTIAVDEDGRVSRAALETVLEEGAGMISVMLANNETGVIQDIDMISACAHRYGALVHSDAAQAAGKIKVDFAASEMDMMSLSAHKLYGPKGVGALVVNKSLDLEVQIHGGGQENGMRAGTENVAGIVGFGAAADLALRQLETYQVRMDALREYLESCLRKLLGVVLFASQAQRLPNTVYMALPGLDGETAVMMLDQDGIAVSSGSSCASGSTEPSHVLLAMGVDPDVARCAIRISLGKDNTMADIDALIAALERHIDTLGSMPAAYYSASM